jgi:hypothetical protein
VRYRRPPLGQTPPRPKRRETTVLKIDAVWIFAGSDSGGERAAAIYTLIETAKLNGLDPEAYLREVFSRIADHPINRIADLFPWNLSPRSATLAA